MPLYPQHFLDQIREMLPPSEVVGKRFKLRREGREFRAIDNHSLTVSDIKRMWFDHDGAGEGGDIFKFEMIHGGLTFEQAVEDLARMAGLALPAEKRQNSGRNFTKVEGPPPDDPGDPGYDDGPSLPISQDSDGRARQRTPAQAAMNGAPTKTYPYTDRDGALLYEVCRYEWVEDGKRSKTFRQRRPSPGEPGRWLWGLAAGEYVRPKWTDDWLLADKDKLKKWAGQIRQRRDIEEEQPHVLYRLPELYEETLQAPEDRRTIFNAEGEKDIETLVAWGLVATTVSGGAKNFAPEHAEMLRGMDVVILMDNDKPGRAAAHKKAAALRGIAGRVRVLDWREHWAACPNKGDVTDWRDDGAGTLAKLQAVVDRLPEWRPVAPESSFGAVRYGDLDKKSRELEYLIKKVITRSEVSIWWGPPGCGKSFLVFDAGQAVSRGGTWFGNKVRQGLVIYQAGEGGLGLKQRWRAYRQHHGLNANDDMPFVLLPQPVNLFADDIDVGKIIEEIKLWRDYYDSPLELVVIDTFASAATGANENASEDVGKVLGRCHRIANETGAHVILIHHTPKAGGSPRGWGGFTGNVAQSVEVIRHEDEKANDSMGVGHDRREMIIRKQKDGEDGQSWSFVLRQVRLGKDEEGEPITSCIVEQVNPGGLAGARRSAIVPPGYFVPRSKNTIPLMNALIRAIEKHGKWSTPASGAPEGTRIVSVMDWRAEYRAMIDAGDLPGSPGALKADNAAKQAIHRCYTEQRWNDPKGQNHIIGKNLEWVWRNTRKIFGIDDPPAPTQTPNRGAPDLIGPDDDAGSLIDEMDRR